MKRLLPTLVAIAALGLLPVASGPVSASTPGNDNPGVAGRVVSKGLCDGGARYRLVVRNERTEDGDRIVLADLTVRRAGAQKRWSLGTEARTEFADGTFVTGYSDGFAHSNRKGVIETGAATPAGVAHGFQFWLSRGRGQQVCLAEVHLP